METVLNLGQRLDTQLQSTPPQPQAEAPSLPQESNAQLQPFPPQEQEALARVWIGLTAVAAAAVLFSDAVLVAMSGALKHLHLPPDTGHFEPSKKQRASPPPHSHFLGAPAPGLSVRATATPMMAPIRRIAAVHAALGSVFMV
ncbi:MAG: hypothetical protein U0984_03790 [Prosthecobacter sp.]|nr:hypothetical protein [Prosthecobacter sp.]